MDARKLNNFFLYLYVISIVFESYDFGGLKGVFSVARLSAVFYILSTLPFIPSRLRIDKFRGTFHILLIFLFFYTFSSFVNQDLLVRLNLVGVEHYFSFPLIQNIFLFIIIVNHIASDEKLIKGVVLSFYLGTYLMGILFMLGFGIEIDKEYDVSNQRLSLFGENVNSFGNKALIGYLIGLWMLLQTPFKSLISRISVLFSLPLFYSMIVASGSRGAIIIALISTIFLLYFYKTKSKIKKGLIYVAGFIFIVSFINGVLSSESVLKERILLTIEEKHVGGRDELAAQVFSYIDEHILFGVSKSPLQIKGEYRDPHNILLAILLSTGICGFVPFLLLNINLLKSSLTHYRMTGNVIVLLLFLTITFVSLKTGGIINRKILWFFYALALGSAIAVNKYKIKTLIN